MIYERLTPIYLSAISLNLQKEPETEEVLQPKCQYEILESNHRATTG